MELKAVSADPGNARMCGQTLAMSQARGSWKNSRCVLIYWLRSGGLQIQTASCRAVVVCGLPRPGGGFQRPRFQLCREPGDAALELATAGRRSCPGMER